MTSSIFHDACPTSLAVKHFPWLGVRLCGIASRLAFGFLLYVPALTSPSHGLWPGIRSQINLPPRKLFYVHSDLIAAAEIKLEQYDHWMTSESEISSVLGGKFKSHGLSRRMVLIFHILGKTSCLVPLLEAIMHLLHLKCTLMLSAHHLSPLAATSEFFMPSWTSLKELQILVGAWLI